MTTVRTPGRWLKWAAGAALLLPLVQACSDASDGITGDTAGASHSAGGGASHSAGAAHTAGASDDTGHAAVAAGALTDPLAGAAAVLGGAAGDPGEADGAPGGAAGDSSVAGAAGSDDAHAPLDIEHAVSTVTQTPRPSFGALVAVDDGERTYLIESRRDVEAGPFGLPWRSRFRLAAYDLGVLAWAFDAQPDDLIGDVVVHPSGEVTLSVERQAAPTLADDLVRLTRDGQVISTTTLSSPLSTPVTDYGPKDPQPLFAMKSGLADATTAGWVRLLPEGEGVVVAFLSYAAPPGNTGPLSSRLALGLEALDWSAPAYVERWARVVEGQHFAEPTAWAYDEFRWLEQAIRPFLARDESSGDLLVGRAWTQSRCQANVAAFAEFPAEECTLRAATNQENELLPLAVTRFSSAGERRGTRILRPDADAAEQLAFALSARDGKLATVGAIVRELPDGSKKTYPDANGYVDYDGYVSLYDANGAQLVHHDYDLGRGDVLAGMRWLDTGIVAVGAAGWDRWQGGMSITRGSDPFFAWFSQDGTNTALRRVPLSDGTRHWNLHDVIVRGSSAVGYGFADAPMTHSADAGGTAARTFGSLWVALK